MNERPTRKGRSLTWLVVLVVILLIPVGYSLVSSLLPSDAAAEPFLERPDPRHERCVRDTAFMRYQHWELLRQVREDVVRYGRRGELGLAKCQECHTSRERFCNRCHEATSLYPDCFDCHHYP